jgi:hypothetical protein
LKYETVVLESFPEQVQIRITTQENKVPDAGVCIQVISEKEFSGEVEASSQAFVSVYLNDNLVE